MNVIMTAIAATATATATATTTCLFSETIINEFTGGHVNRIQ